MHYKAFKYNHVIKIAIFLIFSLILLTFINTKIELKRHNKVIETYLPPTRTGQTSVSMAFSTQLCTFLGNLMIPLIKAKALNYTFPPRKMDHIVIDTMKFDAFTISTFHLQFTYPVPRNLTLGVMEVALSISNTNYKLNYGLLSCHGFFSAIVNKTSVYLNIKPFILRNKTLSLSISTAEVAWGSMAIRHTIEGHLCGAGESIAELLVGQLDEFIARSVRERLPRMLASELESHVKQFFSKIPSQFNELYMTKDHFFVDVDLLPDTPLNIGTNEGQNNTLLLIPFVFETLPVRDIGINLPSETINNYLMRAQRDNLLNFTFILPPGLNSDLLFYFFPKAYQLCPKCMIALVAAAMESPQVGYSSSMETNFSSPNNAINFSVRDFRLGAVMLPDKPESSRVHPDFQQNMLTSHPLFHVLEQILKEAKLSVGSKSIHNYVLRNSLHTFSNIIPLAFFSVDLTTAVANVRFDGSEQNELSFNIMPIKDLNISLLQTNIGYMNLTKMKNTIIKIVNDIIIPMFETHSWLKFPITDGVIQIHGQNFTIGANISSI